MLLCSARTQVVEWTVHVRECAGHDLSVYTRVSIHKISRTQVFK